MAFKKKLTPLEAARMATDVANGMSKVDAAEKYGIGYRTIFYYLNEYDNPVKSRGRKERKYIQPCGTNAGYRQHLRKLETPCNACYAAHALDTLTRKYEKKKKQLEAIIRRELEEEADSA